ncbi:LytR C-terminal domain-containing protein, partial [Candidatus Microgenomates bacterium]|nr:LytR C-terminal domain-containing protein [Candidatus Microgenomates bacterium]
YYDYFTKENGGSSQLSFFAIEKERLNSFSETLALLGLKLLAVTPDTLSYFKLFEKTLRAEKKENIFYVTYAKNRVDGYLYDSGGLLDPVKWSHDVDDTQTIEKVLREKAEELEQSGRKLNRIILSGEQSENIRQDTFTKDVGVWTNPLKRIVPNFYDEYVKMLVVPPGKVFPLLTYDVCFGAFIFTSENKQFQLIKKGTKIKMKRVSGNTTGVSGGKRFFLFRKEVLIFIAAFGISFFAFIALTRSNFKFALPSLTKANPTPTEIPATPEPTASPTPAFKKESVKIKVLNGSGTVGVAATAKSELKKGGFEEILTGNADNFDYKTTEIQVKKGFSSITEDLKKSIADSATDPKVTTLDDKETSDVIIILGADFK